MEPARRGVVLFPGLVRFFFNSFSPDVCKPEFRKVNAASVGLVLSLEDDWE